MNKLKTLAALGVSSLAFAATTAAATSETGVEEPIGDQRFWFERFPKNNAEYATKWRTAREEKGLAVPTAKMVADASRLIERNPLLRERYNSPLGLQQLAMSLPVSRYDRRGAETKLEPVVIDRNDPRSVQADEASVEAWLDQNPQLTTPQEAVEALVAMHGYSNPAPVLRRVERWANSDRTAAFPCGHIREKVIMFDACAKATHILEARAEEASA